MNKSRHRMWERAQKHKAQLVEEKVQYLLSFEELVLQAISAGAPLPGILNRISTALDCQIGNVISLISLAVEDAVEFDPIAMEATNFGLHTFRSARVLGPRDEVLGSLDVYCCVLRSPTSRELEFIERAICLASIAITLDNEPTHQRDGGRRRKPPRQGIVLEWPVSMN
jgi:hypothetical protein